MYLQTIMMYTRCLILLSFVRFATLKLLDLCVKKNQKERLRELVITLMILGVSSIGLGIWVKYCNLPNFYNLKVLVGCLSISGLGITIAIFIRIGLYMKAEKEQHKYDKK